MGYALIIILIEDTRTEIVEEYSNSNHLKILYSSVLYRNTEQEVYWICSYFCLAFLFRMFRNLASFPKMTPLTLWSNRQSSEAKNIKICYFSEDEKENQRKKRTFFNFFICSLLQKLVWSFKALRPVGLQ